MLNIGDNSIRCLERNTDVHQQIQTNNFNSENRSSGLQTNWAAKNKCHIADDELDNLILN